MTNTDNLEPQEPSKTKSQEERIELLEREMKMNRTILKKSKAEVEKMWTTVDELFCQLAELRVKVVALSK